MNTLGYYIETTKDVTYKDYYNLVYNISNKLGVAFDIPEKQGGIVLLNKDSGCKIMKIFVNEYGNITAYRSHKLYNKGEKMDRDVWPSIKLDQYKDNNKRLISKGRKIGTFLSANKELWTNDELKVIEDCLNEIGIKRVSEYPF